MEINTRTWAMATIIRAVRTIAQVAVATIGTTATLQEVDWALVASTSALAGVLSILMALGGLPEVASEPGDAPLATPAGEDDEPVVIVDFD